MLVMSHIIDCNALCCMGMVIAVGRIFVENALEITGDSAYAVTVVWTWFESGGMLSYRLLLWSNLV